MVKKKNVDPVYVVQIWKIKLTFRALVFLVISLIIGTVLIANIGYNKSQGCYWKPVEVRVDLQKKTGP